MPMDSNMNIQYSLRRERPVNSAYLLSGKVAHSIACSPAINSLFSARLLLSLVYLACEGVAGAPVVVRGGNELETAYASFLILNSTGNDSYTDGFEGFFGTVLDF
jgi:hypothetical protein